MHDKHYLYRSRLYSFKCRVLWCIVSKTITKPRNRKFSCGVTSQYKSVENTQFNKLAVNDVILKKRFYMEIMICFFLLKKYYLCIVFFRPFFHKSISVWCPYTKSRLFQANKHIFKINLSSRKWKQNCFHVKWNFCDIIFAFFFLFCSV